MQKLFLWHDRFDKAMVYFLRNLTRNFLEANQNKSFNGLPLVSAAIVDDVEYQEYIDTILMKMGRDA